MLGTPQYRKACRGLFAIASRRRNREPNRRRTKFDEGVFPCGAAVPETGIYEAAHHREHRAPHEVLMLRANLFPPCDQCGDKVHFRVIRTAPYIFDDEDFAQ